MKFIKNTVFSVLLSTIWISISEFVRNELLLKSYWTSHYQNLGLNFPSETFNDLIWGIWSLFLAVSIYIISKKFTLLQTTLLSWFMAFVMMWTVISNLGVLPHGLLLLAIPLSLIESFVASWITIKLS